MNALMSRLYLAALSAALVAGCQTTQPTAATGKAEPEIISVTRQGGKGIPNGRSDSTAPYLRVIKLQTATDPGYGYSAANPIRTGPYDNRLHLLYLNSLRGPKGEPVTYERRGACCEFEDKSIPTGGGLLDVYDIQVDGGSKTITIYVDMYRKGPPLLPFGFTAR
ncbi:MULTISPECIES: hypothetical protein [unclassified Polaromonas]|uniref:hypothetical protein n=1 Tax=unclassified Polaromonas TaxID=2638319 RepID=UPI000F08AE49|nr:MULTISPECIES: hypothetical protein [unclassified Polaromonas]AYQ26818.1 hypothetical protein DT070_01485 [Polaromonas sp. SP1]QGJ18337.1 hypothetical protein F7R28_07965 [Polaromonas sp. Pch-P]